MKKIAFILFLFSQALLAQVSYLLPSEQAIFSFETTKGKKVMLAKDKGNKYIIYRFGTNDKIELEYPEKDKSSWSKFMYVHYSRGGGKANAGLEIDNIVFEKDGYRYVIYRDYTAGDDTTPEKTTVGIAVTSPKPSEITTDINGRISTIKGSWYELRTDGFLQDGAEKYGYY